MPAAKHKSGFVNIIGNPNVGKSTLMNALVGERLSIVTSKAQTTRHRIMGIVNGDDYQIVYCDTPGILKPKYRLQQSMMDFVDAAIGDADAECRETNPEPEQQERQSEESALHWIFPEEYCAKEPLHSGGRRCYDMRKSSR